MELSDLGGSVVTVTERPRAEAAPAATVSGTADATEPRANVHVQAHADDQSAPARSRGAWQTYAIAALGLIAAGQAVIIGLQQREAFAPSPRANAAVAAPAASPAAASVASPVAAAAASPVAAAATATATVAPPRSGPDAPASVPPVLSGDPGSLQRPAALAPLAGARAAAPSIGWLEVRSPLGIDVWEGRRRLGAAAQGRIELDAGEHRIELVNDRVGYRALEVVRIERGRVATLSAEMPTGLVHLNAAPWAEVTLDGQPLGTTPLANVRAPLGDHEIVFRHPQLGERTVRVLVTAGSPVRASVDLRQPEE
jgi:hypothetical protein